MSGSGYNDDCDGWALIRWRGAVASAIRGRRGQAFLRDLLAALDAMPDKRLVADALVFDGQTETAWSPWHLYEDVIVGADELVKGTGEVVRVGEVCALGCLGRARLIDMSDIDPHDPSQVSAAFGISEALAREITYVNDEDWYGRNTPETRFERVRAWVVNNLRKEDPPQAQRPDEEPRKGDERDQQVAPGA